MEITFSLPKNQFITESLDEVTAKVRLFAALGMYQSGEISFGAACELAGVDRYTFHDFCKHQGLSLITQTPDELETEFKKLAYER